MTFGKRVAALYDIHGNLPALRAVLEEMGALDVDRVVVGGDIVWGPFPSETLARLRELDDVTFIRGNADRELAEDAGHSEITRWTAEQLSEEELAFLVGLDESVTSTSKA